MKEDYSKYFDKIITILSCLKGSSKDYSPILSDILDQLSIDLIIGSNQTHCLDTGSSRKNILSRQYIVFDTKNNIKISEITEWSEDSINWSETLPTGTITLGSCSSESSMQIAASPCFTNGVVEIKVSGIQTETSFLPLRVDRSSDKTTYAIGSKPDLTGFIEIECSYNDVITETVDLNAEITTITASSIGMSSIFTYHVLDQSNNVSIPQQNYSTALDEITIDGSPAIIGSKAIITGYKL